MSSSRSTQKQMWPCLIAMSKNCKITLRTNKNLLDNQKIIHKNKLQESELFIDYGNEFLETKFKRSK